MTICSHPRKIVTPVYDKSTGLTTYYWSCPDCPASGVDRVE